MIESRYLRAADAKVSKLAPMQSPTASDRDARIALRVVFGDETDDHVERLCLVVQLVLENLGNIDVLGNAGCLKRFDHEELHERIG